MNQLMDIEAQLKTAIRRMLATERREDIATVENGVGFNGYDAAPMLDMVGKPSWTPKQAHFAWRTLQKYKGQLTRYGVDLAAIPEPVVPKEAIQVKPKPTVEVKDTTAFIRFPYSAELVEKTRAITGRQWDASNKVWLVNLLVPRAILDLERFCQETNTAVPAGLEQLKEAAIQAAVKKAEQDAHQQAEDANRISASVATDAQLVVEGLGGDLMPFQRAGVAYAADAKRCCIADEMGLGKTVQFLATIQHLKAYPALLICPASLKFNWLREAKKWLPGVDVQFWAPTHATLFQDGSYHPAIRRLRIINYDIISKHKDELLKTDWAAIGMDEAHYLKNHKSQRGEAAKELVKGRKVIIALTGTPILNRPGELFTLISLLGRVKDVGGFKEFQKKYLGYNWRGDGQQLEELQKVVRSKFLIRREKKDVLKDLPAKRRTPVEIEMASRKEYERIRTAPLEDSPAAAIVRIGELRREAARQKLEGIKEWVGEFLETGKKLVLFATHRDIQAQLVQTFPGCVQILGDDDIKARQEAVDRFQEDPSVKLVVCSLKAAGVGLTLTAASDVAFAEFGWTPADMDQAEDRCHRIGQRDSVTAYYLQAPQSIDDDMLALIERKRAIAKALLDQGQMPKQTSIEGELVGSILKEARAAGRTFAKREA